VRFETDETCARFRISSCVSKSAFPTRDKIDVLSHVSLLLLCSSLLQTSSTPSATTIPCLQLDNLAFQLLVALHLFTLLNSETLSLTLSLTHSSSISLFSILNSQRTLSQARYLFLCESKFPTASSHFRSSAHGLFIFFRNVWFKGLRTRWQAHCWQRCCGLLQDIVGYLLAPPGLYRFALSLQPHVVGGEHVSDVTCSCVCVNCQLTDWRCSSWAIIVASSLSSSLPSVPQCALAVDELATKPFSLLALCCLLAPMIQVVLFSLLALPLVLCLCLAPWHLTSALATKPSSFWDSELFCATASHCVLLSCSSSCIQCPFAFPFALRPDTWQLAT